MSHPTQTCQTCGRVEIVTPDGRGFPPDIAKRRLEKRCRNAGHECRPTYRAGMSATIERLLEQPDSGHA